MIGPIAGGSGGISTGDIGGSSARGGNTSSGGGITINGANQYTAGILESMGMGGSSASRRSLNVIVIGGYAVLALLLFVKLKNK